VIPFVSFVVKLITYLTTKYTKDYTKEHEGKTNKNMNRRTFVKKSSTAAIFAPAASLFPGASSGIKQGNEQRTSKPSWLLELIRINDRQVKEQLIYRVSDPESHSYGGFADRFDIPNPQSAADFIRASLCALTAPESNYYNDVNLLNLINDAVLYLLKVQHEDGTVDLLSTNFQSTPDTAFIIMRFGPVFKMLLHSEAPSRHEVLKNMKTFMQNAGNALVTGGIHTPNHRWVVCAALGWLYYLWPDKKYLKRAELWLQEGIDMDADGQYHEKSTYIYSPLSNRVLITIARKFNKPELLGYVRRNLEMTMYYVHPNGEVVTEASGRQDKAITGTMENYYYPYRYMALHDNNGQFAAMCRLIEKTAFGKTVPYLHYLLEDSSLWSSLPQEEPLPLFYEKEFTNSGLVRIRRGNYDASIISRNPVFFTFHKGNAVLQGVRIAASFFGKGQFSSEEIRNEDGTWVLKKELQGPYYQPFPRENLPGDGDWNKMPRSERPQSEIQYFATRVSITEAEEGFELDVNISGTDNVPLVVELVFRPGGIFTGVEEYGSLKEAYFLKNDFGTYAIGEDTISFGPGAYAHKWVQLRGALPKMDGPTVYLTGFTPFQKKIKIF